MKFVHLADTHIGMSFTTASFGKEFGEKKREAIKQNFKKCINYCNENTIDLLLIAGDFFENEYTRLSDVYDIKYLFESLTSTKVMIIAGNHDPRAAERDIYTSVVWPTNVKILDTAYTLVNDRQNQVSIIGFSWNSTRASGLNKEEIEGVIGQATQEHRIILLHGDIYTDSEYLPLDKRYLMSLDVDYIALGHIHKSDIIENKIAYPGSLEPLDFKETGDHGFILGEITDKGLTLQRIHSMIYKMKVIEVDISGFQSWMAILDHIVEMVEKETKEDLFSLMVRVKLIGEKDVSLGEMESAFIRQVKEALEGRIAYTEIRNQTTEGYDQYALYKEHEHDLIGYFIKAMEEKGLDDPVNQKALSVGISLLLEAMG